MVTSAEMLSRGFTGPGKPGSAQESEWKRKHLTKALAVPVVKTLWVHRTSVETFNALNLFLQRNGAQLGQKVDDWGFANRPIRNSDEDSMHKYAKAEDLDATENPQRTLSTTFPVGKTTKACQLLELNWGHLWSPAWKDPMHFQDDLSRSRRRWINAQLLMPSPRRKAMAELCNMKPGEFSKRIKQWEWYPGH
jgi:hypothetical protein